MAWERGMGSCSSLVLAFVSLLTLALAAHHVEGSVLVTDLTGTWSLTNGNNVTTSGTVPGVTYTDLLAEGIVEEPYYRFNDEEERWVSLEDWAYSRTFEVTEEFFLQERILLWLEAVDTVAEVRIGDCVVGSTRSMFRRYLFQVPPSCLIIGANTVRLDFQSAATYAQQKRMESTYRIPFTHYAHGAPDRNFVRKAQCHFAWDWGPCFLSAGLWQEPVEVLAYSGAILSYVTPDITKADNDTWTVEVGVYVEGSAAGQEVTVKANVAGASVEQMFTLSSAGEQKLGVTLSVTSPGLWWPSGYGGQPLYNLTVTLLSGQDNTPGPHQESVQAIGFRTIEIVQEPIPNQPGLTFYLAVNKLPIFAKGSNWIPADSFESRVTNDVLRGLLQSVKDANMNIVRNWGGGIYQHDYFYELCDEMGIMVWEEFMFACAMYPRDEAFLDEVEGEVAHQVRRLAYHPSLALWSGNNENEAALTGWYPETKSNPYRYVVDYNYLNTETLFRTLRKYDPSRAWLPSSPSNELLQEEPYVERWGDPYSDIFGDLHYYNYDTLCTDVTAFPTPRFASEYGWQSFPSLYTMAGASEPSDWAYDSPLMQHRQHHPDGTEQINAMMKRLFTFPQNDDSTQLFEDWCYIGQCVQSMCIRAETEHYRRLKSSESRTMGAIYWQLNSIWQAPTWSSLEYGGRWKVLHYHVAHFFAETLVSSYLDADSTYHVYVTTDSRLAQTGNLTVNTVLWENGSIGSTWVVASEVDPFGSVEVFSEPLAALVTASNATAANEFAITLSWAFDDGSDLSSEATNVFYPTSFSEVALQIPTIVISVADSWSGGETGVAAVSVTSSAVTPFAYLHTSISGRFSSNGILLLPNTPVTFIFFGWEEYTLQQLQNTVKVRSVRDTY